MIKIDNLGFSYGRIPVLENISIQLSEGNIYGLLGENGVGKTTLLTLLSGLKKTGFGKIDIDGIAPYDRNPDLLENLYYLPDEVAALNLKARDWADLNGKFRKNYDKEKFLKIMQEFENDADRNMSKMSFGQLKKTYIAFALSINVKYLFMDEPTNGLDIPSKSNFRSALTRYTNDDSVVVISTHQVRDLENLIDPIIILDKRDVLLNASLEEISEKLYFDYGNVRNENSLYTEILPGNMVQVYPNPDGRESKVNIEVLFNAVIKHKDYAKTLFSK